MTKDERQKISVVGCGYVGLTTAICLAHKFNDVICVDVDRAKVNAINSGTLPIFEPHLGEKLKEAIRLERLSATTDTDLVSSSEIIFVCVGTPSNEDGSLDTRYIKKSVRNIANAIKDDDKYHMIAIRSTIIPGTTQHVVVPIIEEVLDNNIYESNIDVAVNPEFLQEGNAYYSFFTPDKIVLGAQYSSPESEYVKPTRAYNTLDKLYDNANIRCRHIHTDWKTAEMIKYASNVFLAGKISLVNEIGNICKLFNIDTYKVMSALSLDERISRYFTNSGLGYGGSCFKKDLDAIKSKANEMNYQTLMIDATDKTNLKQVDIMIKLLKKHLPNLENKKIGILGLSFKPYTDDIRNSRALEIVSLLLNEGAEVSAYDPKAINNFRWEYPQIEYTTSERVLESDAVLILTDWPEFRSYDYTGKIVIDGRYIIEAKKTALIYEGLCW